MRLDTCIRNADGLSARHGESSAELMCPLLGAYTSPRARLRVVPRVLIALVPALRSLGVKGAR